MRLPWDADWPGSSPLGPQWTWQGTTFDGQDVWLGASEITDAGGAPVTIHFGAISLSLKIHVVESDALFKEINP